MRPKHIAHELAGFYSTRSPVFLWGPPGVGKSDIVRQTATDLDIGLVDVRAILLDPVDLRGIPSIRDGRALWAVPDFWPRTGNGILFLDELNAAPPSVQAACYQLVLDRRLGEYVLPEGWSIIGAGNRETDRAVVNRMGTALASRFENHINFDVSLDDWCTWAFTHGIAAEIVAFLRFRPELLHKMPTGAEKTFPCPRTWSFVNRILGRNPGTETEFELYQGAVGEGAATEWTAFLRTYRSLPNIDAILISPAASPVPAIDKPDVLYATVAALTARAKPDNFDRVITYLDRLPREFGVMGVQDSILRNREGLANTRAFVEWATRNPDLL